MNIQHLKHLLAVSKYGNLLLAARELDMSQSGLSRSISGLEEILGVELFVRRARGVEMTTAGQDFLRRAQAILNEYQRATDELKAVKDAKTGRVVIGINHSFAHYITDAVIVEVLKSSPGLEINIATNNYYEMIENLLANRFDFGLSVYFKSEMHPELAYEDIFPFKSMVFANAKHPLAKLKHVTPQDLGGCRWALLEGRGARDSFEAYFRRHEIVQPPIALQSASLALLATVISQLDLVTLLPRQAAMVKFANGNTLQMLHVGEPIGVAHCGLIHRANGVHTPLVRHIKTLFQLQAERYRRGAK